MKRVSRLMKLKFMGIGPGKSQPRWKRGIKLIAADTLMRLRPFAWHAIHRCGPTVSFAFKELVLTQGSDPTERR